MKLRKEFRTERGYLEIYRAQINGDSRFLRVQMVAVFLAFVLILGWILLPH